MYTALAVILSTLSISSSTTALFLPQFRLRPSPSSTPASSSLANKCIFTLFHKQLCHPTASTKINYIQINTIENLPNSLTIDIAALRPAAAHNSYNKISEHQVFAVEGLLDNKNLTVRGENGNDEVRFEYDGVGFSSEVWKNSKKAWCGAGAWDVEDWECGMGSRERKMECAFSCEKITEEDREDVLSNELR